MFIYVYCKNIVIILIIDFIKYKFKKIHIKYCIYMYLNKI